MKTIEIGVVGKFEGKNPIGAADLEWIFACNLPCIRREAPGEVVPVGVRVLNSYVSSCAIHQNGENQIEYI